MLGSTAGVELDAPALEPDDAAIVAAGSDAGGKATTACETGAKTMAAATAAARTAAVAAAEAPPFPFRNIRHIITRPGAVESNPPHTRES
jgi:hypothetical protein